jgi:hypothetical protein
MRGVARTVFQGDHPRSFDVELLGVVPGSRPKGDLILFRAQGDSLEHTGIVAGMSGSPVYIEGRLLGAIAFSFPFAKDPIGMITPIGEMLDGMRQTDAPPASWMGMPTAQHDSWRSAFLDGHAEPALWDALLPTRSNQDGAPPLVSLCGEGWDSALEGSLGRFAERLGLPRPVATAGGSAVTETAATLEPGDAIGVQIVSGDATLAAIGTVTYREGDRIVAFGHPLFQAGPVELPMTTAWIHTIVPALGNSFKMGSSGKVVGSIRQDQRAGIAGVLGEPPAMLPVRVTLDGPGGLITYRYRVARGLLLEPTLIGWAATNSFLHQGWRVGDATLDATLSVHYNNGKMLQRRERLASHAPANDLAGGVLTPIPLLLTNPFEPVVLDSVALEASYITRLHESILIDLWAERERIRPGETLTLTARMKDRHEETHDLAVQIPVPERWRGRTLFILAGGVNELTQWDRERAPVLYEPKDLAGLERLIREFPNEGQLLVRIYGEEGGVIMGDQELGALPPSVARVLGAEHKRGPARPSSNVEIEERRIEAGGSVTGTAAVRVRVE